MPIANEVTYYGHFLMPPHAVKAARSRFPNLTKDMTDAQIRKYVDDSVYQMQLNEEWQPSRKPGEFTCQIDGGSDGPMFPLIVPSTNASHKWCIVSILTEAMTRTWGSYPPEMPNPSLLFSYTVMDGTSPDGREVFERIEAEDKIAEKALEAASKGADIASFSVWRQTPFSLSARTKR